MKNKIIENIKTKLLILDWKKAIVLILSIFMSAYSNYVNWIFLEYLPFLIISVICLILFVFNKKNWVYIFSILLVLNVFDVLAFNFYSIYFGINSLSINVIAVSFLLIHISLNNIRKNKSEVGTYFSTLHKSEKTKKYEYQVKVERFEFKYRDKSRNELQEIIENKDIMTKEAVQAALNQLDNFDTI